ncbi:MAG TPA: beta-ketoacyl-[acyl-carrier-protein] synthase family protein [Pyrinomonadaceae bacterium]|nr:beta-ketoacyl-[acyl-carrier-protein] synthase family protein [Pyrinomonadaceae bacterium]
MLANFKAPRRVVISGMGCVTPIGIGRDAFWDSLQNGASGGRRIQSFDPSKIPIKIAAEATSFDWKGVVGVKESKRVPRTVALALAAARETLLDAGIDAEALTLEQQRQIGIALGTGGGGLIFAEEQYGYWYLGPHSRLSPFSIPAATHGTLSSELSIVLGLRGFSHIISTGCTSSTDAIGYASQQIALGKIHMVLAGGVDAPIAPGIMKGFDLMTVLTRDWEDEPHRASRPFSRDRSGMVLGEGAWMFLLEDFENATARGAHVYAEVAGYGSTCEAFHRVRLREDAEEPTRAIRLALFDASLDPSQIDYVNLHGTSTELNDRIETKAIKQALGDRAFRIPMSSTKSQIGHPQGASGAAGISAALCAMERGVVPPTINLDVPDPNCDLDYVPNASRRSDVRVSLCNCIGFGSKNSAIVVKKV